MSIPAAGVEAWLRLMVAVKELSQIYTVTAQVNTDRRFAKFLFFFKLLDKARATNFTNEH
jgi:hypothetical protein